MLSFFSVSFFSSPHSIVSLTEMEAGRADGGIPFTKEEDEWSKKVKPILMASLAKRLPSHFGCVIDDIVKLRSVTFFAILSFLLTFFFFRVELLETVLLGTLFFNLFLWTILLRKMISWNPIATQISDKANSSCQHPLTLTSLTESWIAICC